MKSLLQHHSSKASILLHSAFSIVQLSHPYMTTGKTIALTRQTFVGKVKSLIFNMLFRLVITFLPRSKRLLISWMQSPYAGKSCKNNNCHNLMCSRATKKVQEKTGYKNVISSTFLSPHIYKSEQFLRKSTHQITMS